MTTEPSTTNGSSGDDGLSVAPPDPNEAGRSPVLSSDAGTDESIQQRLDKNPQSEQARLDRGLDESMDASDPPASTQPVHNTGPAPSSGYDEALEKKLAEGQGS